MFALQDLRFEHSATTYICTGHLRAALAATDGAVAVFADGTVGFGCWGAAVLASPAPMVVLWRRPAIETILAAADGWVADAARGMTRAALAAGAI
ncbi:MAG: hypothetical protein WA988_17435 [Candidatus Nanopelagicales bacterium]